MASMVYQGPPLTAWDEQNLQNQYFLNGQQNQQPPFIPNQFSMNNQITVPGQFVGGRQFNGSQNFQRRPPPARKPFPGPPASSNKVPLVGSPQGIAYRRENQLEVEGVDVPDPVLDFQSAGFTQDILTEILRAGFVVPTPIQAQCWPIIMTSKDLVGIAKTGSGKTCAFLLPGLMHIMAKNDNPRFGPTMLVMAPTRELAMQTQQEANKFGNLAGVKNACLYGGAPRNSQFREIQRGPHIVIATPGRLNDFLESGALKLRNVSYLVLDEADRMLDMGFEPQIRQVLDHMPAQKRQTLLFSATWPREVREIASQYMSSDIVNVFIGGGANGEATANTAVEQTIEIIDQYQKKDRLLLILQEIPREYKTIIFTQTKKGADDLTEDLYNLGAQAIHGDKGQNERDYVMRNFKSGKFPLLVATDVAARGLDIPNVNLVVNYDFPQGVDDYVHRIGRTGRAGASGKSITFLTWDEQRIAKDLIKVLEKAQQPVPNELRNMAYQNSQKQGGKYFKSRYQQRSSYGKYQGGAGQECLMTDAQLIWPTMAQDEGWSENSNWRDNKIGNSWGDDNSKPFNTNGTQVKSTWGDSWGNDDNENNNNTGFTGGWGDDQAAVIQNNISQTSLGNPPQGNFRGGNMGRGQVGRGGAIPGVQNDRWGKINDFLGNTDTSGVVGRGFGRGRGGGGGGRGGGFGNINGGRGGFNNTNNQGAFIAQPPPPQWSPNEQIEPPGLGRPQGGRGFRKFTG